MVITVRSREGHRITQKRALDTHLDSNRNATATVGRINSGTEAPIISPLRLCSRSWCVKLPEDSDMSEMN